VVGVNSFNFSDVKIQAERWQINNTKKGGERKGSSDVVKKCKSSPPSPPPTEPLLEGGEVGGYETLTGFTNTI
jgi:hypothetical protein